jgi:putative NIF3 family GTP cyclohydrolase 1 type 2
VTHTNADRAAGHGVSDALAAALGLTDVVPLEPVAVAASEGARSGLGRVGVLPDAITLREFATRVATTLPATPGGVRVAGDPGRLVRTVAVCGGSGGSLFAAAASAGADVFLTSDLKHHAVSEALEIPGPALCDVAHYATERPWIPVAADLLCRDLGGRVGTTVSTQRTDPWTWHVASRAARASTTP